MAHSPTNYPPSYPTIPLPPEGGDYWFTVEELGAFIGYSQPRPMWERRFKNAWPWRIEDGVVRFSAYAVWNRLHARGLDFQMPADFRAYFEAMHCRLAAPAHATA